MGPCEKVWSTAADPRVCEKCMALAGKRIGFDKGFSDGKRSSTGSAIVPPAHPRCRCVVEYVEIAAPVIKPLNVNPENGTIEANINETGKVAAEATLGLGRGMERRTANTGAFSNLEVPMQKREVERICREYGVDISGLKIKIQRDAGLLKETLIK